MQTTNNSIDRFNQIEKLRDQLRPQKTYEVMKPTAQSVNIIDGTINGHGVKFIFYYQPTKADMKNAHHATKLLETNLRDGVAIRKAHLAQLVETDITEYTDILTINSKDLDNPLDPIIMHNQQNEGESHERE